MYQFHFERLEIWKLSMNLTVNIYKITASFPSEERFGITSQIRRAATSVSANIAEGSGRTGIKDKARFFQISFSSLMEVLNFLLISSKLLFISESKLIELRKDIEELSNKINAYHKKLV